MNTTRKTILAALVLAVCAIVVTLLIRSKTPPGDPVPLPDGREGAQASPGAPNPGSSVTGRSSRGERDSIPAEYAALEAKYGATATRRAIKLSTSFREGSLKDLKDTFSDLDAMRADIRHDRLAPLAKDLGLDDAQKEKLDKMVEDIVRVRQSRYEDFLKRGDQDVRDMTETLLASDAHARNQITEDELKAVVARTSAPFLQGGYTSLSESFMVMWNYPDSDGEQTYDPFARMPEERVKLTAMLDAEQAEAYRKIGEQTPKAAKFSIHADKQTLDGASDLLEWQTKVAGLKEAFSDDK